MLRSPLFWRLASGYVGLVLLPATLPGLVPAEVSVTIIVAALAGAFVFIARFVQRIQDLSQGAAAVADGQDAPPLPVAGKDEIASLARAIDELGQQLRQERAERQRELYEHQERLATVSASRERSDFLAVLGHEIRTPLNGIMGMTQLALQTPLGAEQREYLEIVQSSAEFLRAVVHDLNDFYRIEAGTLTLALVRFALRPVVTDTVKMLGLRAHQKGLELLCTIASEVPDTLEGDPDRLRQLLINLIGNAIRFTERGEVVVEVTRIEDRGSNIEPEPMPAQEAPPDSVLLQFSIADTGVGIAPEQQEALFPATDVPGPPQAGAALGLTIARYLVERMGGHIGVESVVGKGSTFRFTARFRRASAVGLERTPPRTLPMQDIRALIVDDNAAARRFLEQMLGGWQMRTTAVADAETALAALEQAQAAGGPFAVALLDARLLRVDGFALVEQLRQRPTLADTPLVMLLSSHPVEDAARCRQLRVAAHVVKPLLPDELRLALHAALTRSQSPVPEAPAPVSAAPPQSLHVLLAEANSVNRQLAVVLLEKLGHRVTLAADGVEVLAALEQGTFDVLLIELDLPRRDGVQTAAAIREKEKGTGRHLPIIATIAYGATGERERCLAAGIDSCLTRPLQIRELVRAINSILLPPASDYQL